MTLNITIKTPTEQDYRGIVRVVNSELAQYSSVLSTDELQSLGIGAFSIDDLVSMKDKRNYLVAKHNDQIVGFLSWYTKPNQIAWVSFLEVLPEYQGQGVGKKLLTEAEQEARKKSCLAIALETQTKAVWAVKFYEKNAYQTLTQQDLDNPPYQGTLANPIVEGTTVLGKDLRF